MCHTEEWGHCHFKRYVVLLWTDSNHSWRACWKPPAVANQTLSWIHPDNSHSWDSWHPSLCPDPNGVLGEHGHAINFLILLDSCFCFSFSANTRPSQLLFNLCVCSSFCLIIQLSAYPSFPASTLAVCWGKPCSRETSGLSVRFAALQTKIVKSAKQCTPSFIHSSFPAREE